MPEDTELGKATYEAFKEHHWINNGPTLPPWESLGALERSAWIAAGSRAIRLGLQRLAPEEPVTEDSA